jgi:hypothetical protein
MTGHRSAFRAEIEALLKADEQHLTRLRLLLVTTQERLFSAPDDPILSYQAEALESIINSSTAKMALLRKTLEKTAPERDGNGDE